MTARQHNLQTGTQVLHPEGSRTDQVAAWRRQKDQRDERSNQAQQ